MIKLIKPYITFGEVEQDFRRIFETGMFTKASYVNEFIAGIKDYTGAKYAFLTTSATTALSMCLKIIGIGVGDEVIISDFSFPATVNVVEDIGAKPVFVDVNPQTFNMIPEELEKNINSRTKAVIFVDALGNVSGISKIKEICKKYKIVLIEDAACAIGSSENGIKSGNIADLTCFSFHPRKLLTTGEGGAITTNSIEFNQILSIKLNHGAIVNEGKIDFVDFGFNYRLPELQAAMGIKQLQNLDKIIEGRNLIRDQVEALLLPLGFRGQVVYQSVVHNVQSLVFIVPENINRDDLIIYLAKQGIESTIGTYCLSNTTYYRGKYNSVQPIASYLEQKTITLPCYDGVDYEFICNEIKNYTCLQNG